jgi:DNA-directed RNA polymerase specialized sigma24 family protein
VEQDPGQADAERTLTRLRAVLSQSELEVLLFSWVARLSEKEIAQVVRRSERVVRSILCRAGEKAREALATDANGERQETGQAGG